MDDKEEKKYDLLDEIIVPAKRIATQPVSKVPTVPLTKQSSQYGEVKSARMQE